MLRVLSLLLVCGAVNAQTPPAHPATTIPPAQPPIDRNATPPAQRTLDKSGKSEPRKTCYRDVFYTCPDEKQQNCVRKEAYPCPR